MVILDCLKHYHRSSNICFKKKKSKHPHQQYRPEPSTTTSIDSHRSRYSNRRNNNNNRGGRRRRQITSSGRHQFVINNRPPTPNCHCSCHQQPSVRKIDIGGRGDHQHHQYSTLSSTGSQHCHSSHLYSTVFLRDQNKDNNGRSCCTAYESLSGFVCSPGLSSPQQDIVAASPQFNNRFPTSTIDEVAEFSEVEPELLLQNQDDLEDSYYSDISINVYEEADKYNQQQQRKEPTPSLNPLLPQQIISTDTSSYQHHKNHHHRVSSLVDGGRRPTTRKNHLHLVRLDPFKFTAMEPLHVDNKIIVFSLVDTFTKLSPNKILENYIKKLQDEGKTSITIFNLSEPLQFMKNSSLNVAICEYGWPEKRAPSLEKLCSLCKSIDAWLNVDRSRNICVIYSKRDLSRSSLAIAVFLQYIDICLGQDSFFDYESMYNFYHFHLEGYLQPSQKRYVHYFKSLLSGDSKINNQRFHLNQIVLRKIPNFDGNGLCKPFIKIYQGLNLVYSSQIIDIDHSFVNTWDFIVFNIKPPLKLRGEILVKCYHKIMSPSSRTEMFSFQFHTGTLTNNQMIFNKDEIDIAQYDKRFHKDTRVELIFNDSHQELIQTVNFIDDAQITKCNSYENFFGDTNGKGLEYTKGPLDGSLYATVSKRPLPTCKPNEDEIVLDELINEIFSEIQSFPDGLKSPIQFNTTKSIDNDYTYDYLQLPKTTTTTKNEATTEKENFDPELNADQQSVLSDNTTETDSIDWLERQKRKLKLKQTKKEFVEKRLIEELKSTISSQHDKHIKQLQQQAPEVPARTSSRNIWTLDYNDQYKTVHHNFDMIFPQENGTSQKTHHRVPSPMEKIDDSELDEIDDQLNPMIQLTKPHLQSTSTNFQQRSTTPAFPVREQKVPKPKFDSDSVNTNGPMFIKDTSSFWYKPNISREDAIKYLYDKQPGSFIIRDSNSFPNSFGLAVKVPLHESRHNSEPIRHFLIESTNKGVQIKGCPEEPVFSTLAALVYQHSITRISLPIALIIPSTDMDNGNDSYLKRFYDNGAACNVLYFISEDVESLTGPMAVKKVINNLFENQKKIRPAVIHFKASIKGITLTDNSHRLFFRRHYPLKSISYCSVDPENRSWNYKSDQTHIYSNLYGFVTRKKTANLENTCLIFGHFEPDQPSHAIVDFVNKLINS